MSKERIIIIDGIRTARKGIRTPNTFRSDNCLADISFFKFGMLDVDVVGNTHFHRKDIDLKITQLVKMLLHKDMGVGCSE